jgi:hypothetical protein
MKYLPPELLSIIRQYAGVRPNVTIHYIFLLKELVTNKKFKKAFYNLLQIPHNWRAHDWNGSRIDEAIIILTPYISHDDI